MPSVIMIGSKRVRSLHERLLYIRIEGARVQFLSHLLLSIMRGIPAAVASKSAPTAPQLPPKEILGWAVEYFDGWRYSNAFNNKGF